MRDFCNPVGETRVLYDVPGIPVLRKRPVMTGRLRFPINFNWLFSRWRLVTKLLGLGRLGPMGFTLVDAPVRSRKPWRCWRVNVLERKQEAKKLRNEWGLEAALSY